MINWSPGSSAALEGTASSYTITELEAGETYTISLTATNNAGSTTSTLTASTTDQGTESVNLYNDDTNMFLAAGSNLAVAAGAAGGGAVLAIALVVLCLVIILCVVCSK